MISSSKDLARRSIWFQHFPQGGTLSGQSISRDGHVSAFPTRLAASFLVYLTSPMEQNMVRVHSLAGSFLVARKRSVYSR